MLRVLPPHVETSLFQAPRQSGPRVPFSFANSPLSESLERATFKPVLQQITVSESYVNTDFCLIIHRSYFTCCKIRLPWANKTRKMYRFCCKKQNLICCKKGLKVGRKTRTIVSPQWCKTSWTFLLLALPYLNVTQHLHVLIIIIIIIIIRHKYVYKYIQMRQRQHTIKAHRDNRIQHIRVKKTLHLKLNGDTHVTTRDKTLSFFSHDEKPTLCVFLVCAFVAFISS